MPSKYIPTEHVPSDLYEITWINPNAVSMNSGVYYGDASGGEYSSYPEIRRVGCSFVSVAASDGALLFGAHFPLPGSVQTVPRGELFTLVELIKQARDGAEITYVTDNKWVYDTYNGGSR